MDPLATFALTTENTTPVPAEALAEYSLRGGYAALEESASRRSGPSVSLAEDRVLRDRQRVRLDATTREVYRNFAIACWAVNKHLDYVSQFTFRAATDDEGFNRDYERFIEGASARGSFDLARRHDRATATRLAECHNVLDGDQAWLKYAGRTDRGRVELIEGDRIQNVGLPAGRTMRAEEKWVNGFRIDPRTGRTLEAAIADRTDSGFAPGRAVRFASLLHTGYYQRYDQVRGVSPLASAINSYKDTDETFDYARAKVKLAQMMGLVVKRSADGPLGDYLATQLAQRDRANEDEGESTETQYDVDLSNNTWALDLDRGDDVALLESKTPATETVNFLKFMTHVALRVLDIPYSFFDESFTNFYGSRGGHISYINGCRVKRQRLIDQLDAWTRWRTGLAIADGSLTLPSGWDFSDLRHVWHPAGQPWWDPVKEVTAAFMEIGGALNSPQAICHALGRDFERNVDQIAEAHKYAAEKGVPLSFAADATTKALLADNSGAEDRTAPDDLNPDALP